MSNLIKLPAYFDKKAGEALVRCVIESPMGSATKFKYDPETKTFVMSRPLLKGLTYPFDWGFIPSTMASDGDPVDVMVIHDSPGFSGLVIPGQIIGVLEVEQRGEAGRERNDRLFAVPIGSHREDEINHVDDISQRLRKELERFFLAAAALENKELAFLGWKGPKEALSVIDDGMRRYEKQQ